MLKILATADLHGNLPPVDPCDLLLIGGDMCPDFAPAAQADWLNGPFRRWLTRLKQHGVKRIVGIAGNHDFVFENENTPMDLDLPWTYLQDSETTVEGLRIYGIPWVPNLPSWAFYGSKKALHKRYLAIPKGTDIVLSHGPPNGYGDKLPIFRLKANEPSPHVGSKSARDMLDRVKPKVVICGHIHEGFGYYVHRTNDHHTQIYNVSYVDEIYRPRGQIIEIIVDGQQEQEASYDSEREIHAALACA